MTPGGFPAAPRDPRWSLPEGSEGDEASPMTRLPPPEGDLRMTLGGGGGGRSPGD